MRTLPHLETRDDNDDPIAAATRVVEELRTGSETFRTQMGERLTTEMRGVTERLDGLELRMNRPGAGAAADPARELEERAFGGFVRRGRESLAADEVRALRVADDTAGGYLAPDQFVAEIIRNLVQVSPIRAAARVGTMSAAALKIPRRTGTITAKWVGEIEQRPPTQPSYGEIDMAANEMSCFVDVSNQLLEDSAFDIAAELSFDFAEEFGRLEGQAFVAGDGVKKPLGILSEGSVPTVPSGAAATINTDSLISLAYALPSAYRNRGAWLMNTASIATIRKFKDIGGNYIWQANYNAGEPATLLGYPIIEAPDMPDIAAGATPIVFGDFSTAFRIYDRVGLSILRNPYTLDVFGQTRFTARRRVAAGVVKGEALRKLTISAS